MITRFFLILLIISRKNSIKYIKIFIFRFNNNKNGFILHVMCYLFNLHKLMVVVVKKRALRYFKRQKVSDGRFLAYDPRSPVATLRNFY